MRVDFFGNAIPQPRAVWVGLTRTKTHNPFKESCRSRHIAWSRRLKRRARRADDLASALPTPPQITAYQQSDRFRFSSERGR